MHRSTDGGTTWQLTGGHGLGSQSILTLAVHPANPDIVWAATGAPALFRTQDGGETWVHADQGISSLHVWAIAIDWSWPDTVYAGIGGAGVFKSRDGGASWRPSSAGQVPNSPIKALLIDPVKPSVLWAGGQGTGVYRSADGGGTWVQVNAGLSTRDVRVMAISDDGGTVYAGTMGEGVFRLDVPVPPKVRSHPASAAVSVGGQVSFAAAASGTPAPTVQWQVSRNGGAIWSDISGATATTYSCLATTPDNGSRYRAVFTNSEGTASSNPRR